MEGQRHNILSVTFASVVLCMI